MTPAQHDTFTIERLLDAPPSLVFHAWADKNAKARWSHGGNDWIEDIREQNFQVGGRDVLIGHRSAGAATEFRAQYLDIETDRRIVYVYDMFHAGKKISISLATVEFLPQGSRTTLKVTEQGAFLDGFEDKGGRKHGVGLQMDMLEAALKVTQSL